jgi:hypothetical protein
VSRGCGQGTLTGRSTALYAGLRLPESHAHTPCSSSEDLKRSSWRRKAICRTTKRKETGQDIRTGRGRHPMTQEAEGDAKTQGAGAPFVVPKTETETQGHREDPNTGPWGARRKGSAHRETVTAGRRDRYTETDARRWTRREAVTDRRRWTHGHAGPRRPLTHRGRRPRGAG